jgi:general secretion pathway protein G
MVILGLLIALLLPAINAAMKSARNATVGAEINQLAQALASFKAKYGDYPPSRILLWENGYYPDLNGPGSTTPVGPGDITFGQLAQRSVAALRKFFPRVVLNTSGGSPFANNPNRWYDFNGDGVRGTRLPNGTVDDKPYILQGHECLVFFLGGIPVRTDSGFGMTGFGKDPTNPFSNSIASDPNYGGNPNPMYSANRQPPLFEFVSNRLVIDPLPLPYPKFFGLTVPGIPGYVDTLGSAAGTGGDTINFYAYFSAYGNNGYDPNDVNFATDVAGNVVSVEVDAAQQHYAMQYHVAFPTSAATTPPTSVSVPPNPYTSSFTLLPAGTTTFLNPQSFQIISSGQDGLYGPGGQYLPDSTAALPIDGSNPYVNTSDTGIRTREKDNITNFHNGKLE